MRRHGQRVLRLLRFTGIVLLITGTFTSCSGSSSSRQGAEQFAHAKLREVNEPLNATSNYALERSDVVLLQSEGLLVDGDQPLLNQLAKK